jgi:hypothetical protein
VPDEIRHREEKGREGREQCLGVAPNPGDVPIMDGAPEPNLKGGKSFFLQAASL